MLTKSYTDIIKEVASLEECVAGKGEVSDVICKELQARYKECTAHIQTIDKGLVAYKEDMVPVFTDGEKYFVEMDNVLKYMNYAKLTDVKEAMYNIAEANEISLRNMSLVLESKEYMDSVIDEATELSKLGDKSLLEDCEVSVKLINMLKEEGINVVVTH